ncbi:MAG TPA: glycosyltransferase, partial [Acidothermaceae bacterium]|nr:glycosyltransferase [Acidothermaceae bacterium]
MNAVAELGSLDLCAWFDEERQPDRSWDVDPSNWSFDHQWVPTVRLLGKSVRLPIDLLMSSRPDVVVQLFDQPHVAVGALVSRAYAKRVTFRVLPTFEAWGRDTVTTRSAKRFLFRAVDAAKVPGADGAEFASRFGMPPERNIRVRQTIDIAHYRSATEVARNEVREQYGLRGVTFIYVGRLWKGKGLDYLLQAFAEMRKWRSDVSLLLVGDGIDEAYYRAIAASIPDVTFVGFVQPVELPRYYAAADV